MKKKKNNGLLNNLTKIFLLVFIFLWFCISLIDGLGYIFRNRLTNLFFFRAWEHVSNYDGVNANYATFKPWIRYDGYLEGDLLNLAFLKSHRTEKKKQHFIVDEYGFRNSPHFLDKPIDAVVIGTSFVGGAALDQSELISTILTNTYGIRTYNYTESVQDVWEDEKFKKNPPKFLIYMGADADIISVNWFYSITDRVPLYKSFSWKSYKDWENEDSKKRIFTFENFAADLRNFSLVRVAANDLYKEILNFHRDWGAIVGSSIQDMSAYDPESKMLFFQPEYSNPILGSNGKTMDDINKAIDVLNQTEKKLETRNIKLVIAAMPAKTYAEMKKYRNLKDDKSALAVYNRLAEANGNFINVDLLKPAQENFGNPNFHLYFPDDSHWNGLANKIAAKAIAEKICPYLPAENICHKILKI